MSTPPTRDGASARAAQAVPTPDRLGSWKEIGAYLGVTARTAQRWERQEGLPVHRQMHATLGSAYAFRSELDAWRGRRVAGSAATPGRQRDGLSIAVLPFTNLNRDLSTEILADGLTEELISTLAQVPGLRVAARTSSFYFKDKRIDIREVGTALGVETVLEGSVRAADGRIRAVAQLIDARTGLHLWSEPFESGRTDVLALQRDLAHAVAGTLRATMAPRHSKPVESREQATAYRHYLEGMYYWNRRTPAGFLKAVECFERAVGETPRWRSRGQPLPAATEMPSSRRRFLRRRPGNAWCNSPVSRSNTILARRRPRHTLARPERSSISTGPERTGTSDARWS